MIYSSINPELQNIIDSFNSAINLGEFCWQLSLKSSYGEHFISCSSVSIKGVSSFKLTFFADRTHFSHKTTVLVSKQEFIADSVVDLVINFGLNPETLKSAHSVG